MICVRDLCVSCSSDHVLIVSGRRLSHTERELTMFIPGIVPLCHRLPNRPVINTPVVSAMVYSEGTPLPSSLQRPVSVEFALLETEERSKPVCVFWNHSLE